jgi:predicted small secreted protein
MLRWIVAIVLASWLLVGCKEDADNTVEGDGKAVGIAEKMKGGTTGAQDMEGGE